ncbi:MAG: hypothetical protein LBM87_02325 [Ruminococcus sp.]|nr:hypothetical protein [Ruminococcus sp.]
MPSKCRPSDKKALGAFQVPLLAENQEPAKSCEYRFCVFWDGLGGLWDNCVIAVKV